MRFGSLFSGIDGIGLGLEWAGFTPVWQVEQDAYATKVLEKRWPGLPRYGDVRTISGRGLVDKHGPVDLLCGGPPCQDISNAGKRRGITGPKSGLWAEFARVVEEVRPPWVLVENVAAMRSRGLDRVLRDLAASGYLCEWDCLPASAFGAPHRRDRIVIVGWQPGVGQANTVGVAGGARRTGDAGESAAGRNADRSRESGNLWPNGRVFVAGAAVGVDHVGTSVGGSAVSDAERNIVRVESRGRGGPGWPGSNVSGVDGFERDVVDADCARLEIGGVESARDKHAAVERAGLPNHAWTVEPGVGVPAHGLPGRLRGSAWGADWEAGVPRIAHGVPNRVDKLRCLGNSAVPQVFEHVGRLILAAIARGELASAR